MSLERQLEDLYGVHEPGLERLHVPVNDIVVVTNDSARYVLKVYNRSRTRRDVEWETAVIRHLLDRGVPVVGLVAGADGWVEDIVLDGAERPAVLYEWVPGEKPTPSHDTYVALGDAAARIHAALDDYTPEWARDTYDASMLIDEQIVRMQSHLRAARRYDEMRALGDRLTAIVADPALDRGLCHMDLTLDNVHRTSAGLTVFDFDSAGWCWRAMEPWGVLRFSDDYFEDWLRGYRRVRPFGDVDERAVGAFGIIGDIRNVVWKLGEAASSRGAPLLTARDLPAVVDGWLSWEQTRL